VDLRLGHLSHLRLPPDRFAKPALTTTNHL